MPTPLNNVAGLYLASPHASGAATLVLNAGAGDQIRSAIAELGAAAVSPSSPIRVTIAKASAVNSFGQIIDRTQLCIFDATGLSGDTLSGLTTAEGKTDPGFAAGDRVGLFMTAGMLALKMNTGDPISSSQLPGSGVAAGTYAFATVTVDTKGRVTVATDNAAALAALAPLVSPPLSGTPTAPTATVGTNTAQLATTAFVAAGLALKADDSNTVHKTGSAQTVDAATTFSATVTAGSGVTLTSGNFTLPYATDRRLRFGTATDAPGIHLLGGMNVSCDAANPAIVFNQRTGLNTYTEWGRFDSAGRFLVGASAAGSAGAQSESKAKDASTPIFAGYDYLGTLKFLVGPDGTVTISTALKLPAQADASIPISGLAWSTTNPNTLKCRTPAGTLQTVSFGGGGGSSLIFVATADATIANSAAETTLFGSGTGSLTLAANALTVGKTYRVKLIGQVSAASGGYTVKLKVGSVVLYNTGSLTLAVATAQLVEIDAIITCRATGSTATVMGSIVVKELAFSSGRFGAGATSFAAGNVDTTASNAIDITWTFSTAAAGNTITVNNATVEALN